MAALIPVSRPDLGTMDAEAVSRAVLDTFVAGGPAVGRFEAGVAARCGRRFGVAVANGTEALALALRALELPAGSRVLVPTFTIVSALYAVLSAGHHPVFADINPQTWNLDLESVERALAAGIDAAIVVETYAAAPPMAAIRERLQAHGVPWIEDAAEGFGGRESGEMIGGFGPLTTLSFYANKLITTGEGGMVLTDDPVLAERLRDLRNLAFDRERRYIHHRVAGNSRLSNLQATLGLAQLERMDAFRRHREAIDRLYRETLGGHPALAFQELPDGQESSFWVFPVRLRPSAAGLDAVAVIEGLARRGVEARHFFFPLDRQPCLPVPVAAPSSTAWELWRDGFYLPQGNGITEDEAQRAALALIDVLAAGG